MKWSYSNGHVMPKDAYQFKICVIKLDLNFISWTFHHWKMSNKSCFGMKKMWLRQTLLTSILGSKLSVRIVYFQFTSSMVKFFSRVSFLSHTGAISLRFAGENHCITLSTIGVNDCDPTLAWNFTPFNKKWPQIFFSVWVV